MDYEKAYKESFEAAKGLHEAGNALTKKQMEIVFPQLAESEDEGIRKILINIVKGACGKCGVKYKDDEITEEKMLAYLEKQKEQNDKSSTLHWRTIEEATTKRTDEGDCVTTEKMLVKGLIDGEDYRIIDKDTMVNRNLLCVPVKELNAIDKQKEQKPAEWSEDEKQLLDSMIYDYEKAAKSFCGYDGKIGLLKAIRNGEYNLSKQEWSEEDEMLMDELESYIQYDKEFNEEQKSWRIKRLKSLRPSWKPSEEQMKALSNAVKKARTSYFTSIDEDDGYIALQSLYEELNCLPD